MNAPAVVRWNTDKHYLAELAAAGVPVVPTAFLEPGAELEPPGGRFVVKPRISAGGRQAASYEAHELELARRHLERLHADGRSVMVQPYLEGVDALGEAALMWLGGAFSHAVTKSALLGRGRQPGSTLYLEETIAVREASAAERTVGEQVPRRPPVRRSRPGLRARGSPPNGGRPGGAAEVELTEPSLFLGYEPGAADRARRTRRSR